MKTHKILTLGIIAFTLMSFTTLKTVPGFNQYSVDENSIEEEVLMIEEWMVDDGVWDVKPKTNFDEVKEEPLKIESWMFNDELWNM